MIIRFLKNTSARIYASITYIGLIVLLNCLFVYMPYLTAFGQRFTFADMAVGFIYVVRDFAQRELRHYVLIAMVVGAVLSYFLASREIALASISGFCVGEMIDWGIYTFSKKTLSSKHPLSNMG